MRQSLPRAATLHGRLVAQNKTPKRKVQDGFATLNSGCATLEAGGDVTAVATSMLIAYIAIKSEVPAVEPLPVDLQRFVKAEG
jgi:hypothetical protein